MPSGGAGERVGGGRGWGLGLLLLVGLLAGGCGYHLPGRGAGPEGGVRVHLAALENETFVPGLQGQAAAAIRRELLLMGGVALVEEPAAGLVLSGKVAGYSSEAVAFDRAGIGRRFRVRVSLQLTARERPSGRLRFEEAFRGEAFYTVGAGVQAARSAEEEATRRATQEAAERLRERLILEW